MSLHLIFHICATCYFIVIQKLPDCVKAKGFLVISSWQPSQIKVSNNSLCKLKEPSTHSCQHNPRKIPFTTVCSTGSSCGQQVPNGFRHWYYSFTVTGIACIPNIYHSFECFLHFCLISFIVVQWRHSSSESAVATANWFMLSRIMRCMGYFTCMLHTVITEWQELGNLCNKCLKWLLKQKSSYSDYLNAISGFTLNSRAPGGPVTSIESLGRFRLETWNVTSKN